MNWMRVILTTLVGGVAMWLTSFVAHGLLLGSTYLQYPEVFSQEAANPFRFLGVEILIAFPAVLIFAKTRGSWAAGVGGGVAFGFWVGLVGAFGQLFLPMVITDFPCFLGWYWVGISVAVSIVLGIVAGLMIQES
ncbi:MAG: hypothetical protein DHS20C21_05920 [Gemmatimonadota bacterium]|nr:MAG: hypothetical protein DHS20C21_05920 [Gemmatimonadota bacterium]